MGDKQELSQLLARPIVRHFVSLIVAVILGLLSAFANHWTADLAIGVIGFCATQMLIVATSVVPAVQNSLITTQNAIAALRTDVTGMKPYVHLVQHEHSLEHLAPAFTFALDSVVKTLAEHGLAVVSADNGIYLDLLKNALHHGKDSYFATLVQPYSPWWFFSEEGLQSWRKKSFLEVVRNATGFNEKTRLLIYDWYKPIEKNYGKSDQQDAQDEPSTFEKEFLSNPETVKQFLELAGQDLAPNGVKHYLFDWGYTRKLGGLTRLRDLNLRLHDFISWIISDHEDFGIVDGKLVIKKRPYFEVQVIPLLDQAPLRHRAALDIFRSAEEWWIPLSPQYVDSCVKAGSLLSKSEYTASTTTPAVLNPPNLATIPPASGVAP